MHSVNRLAMGKMVNQWQDGLQQRLSFVKMKFQMFQFMDIISTQPLLATFINEFITKGDKLTSSLRDFNLIVANIAEMKAAGIFHPSLDSNSMSVVRPYESNGNVSK